MPSIGAIRADPMGTPLRWWGRVEPLGAPLSASDVSIASVAALRGETAYLRWGETSMLAGALGAAQALRRRLWEAP